MNITRDEDDYKGNGYKVDAKKTKIIFIVFTKNLSIVLKKFIGYKVTIGTLAIMMITE